MNNEHLYLWAQWGVLRHDHFQCVLNYFGDLKTAWEKITPSFFVQLGFGQEKVDRIFQIREKLDLEFMTRTMSDQNIHLFCISDSDYPEQLKNIPDPPPFLFVRGKIPPLHKTMGVVGTRKITDYGKLATDKIVSGLCRHGFTVVSGLALGVDALAHHITVDYNACAMAVLGSGVDQIYPRTNLKLAHSILKQKGCLISEYPIGTPPAPHHFPERNRIISGLSRGIVVIEGDIKSGALITARMALEQGRDVFAVPSSITKTTLSGTNHLIRKGEAKLIESVKDILDEYQMSMDEVPTLFDLSDEEKQILDILSSGPRLMDELIINTSLSVPQLSSLLISLKLKGAVREMGMRWAIS